MTTNYLIEDSFPSPSLNSSKWNSTLIGDVGLDVGTPTDGVYPLSLDVVDEEVRIDTENKIYVPANNSFDVHIFYNDLYNEVSPPVERTIYFGYRSLLKGEGLPLWGVDIMLHIDAGPVYTFRKRTVEDSVVTITDLIVDPLNGDDGGFRVVRDGTDYELYRYDGSWILLDTVSLGFKKVGFIHFGVYTEPVLVSETGFPWILEP